MPAIDFTEIPGESAEGQDTFEWFARDFLEALGFETILGPDRGADAGRDLVMREVRVGPAGRTHIDWLVSCKHNAGSGRSVSASEETDIGDRVAAHNCNGFMAFYSTGPSSGLATKLNSGNLTSQICVFDRERIEHHLLTAEFRELARRYFPASMDRWLQENVKPSAVFSDPPVIECDNCGADLLSPLRGNLLFIERRMKDGSPTVIEHVYAACKGVCDQVLTLRHAEEGVSDAWTDIDDLAIPLLYVRAVAATLNQLHSGEYAYEESAFEKTKRVLLQLFPLVAREVTSKEKKRIESLGGLPGWAGGLG